MSEFDPAIKDELLMAVQTLIEDESSINLLTPTGCLEQQESCSRGLAYLDHLFGRALDDKGEYEREWDSVKAACAKSARRDAPKAATAAEINGLITEHVNRRPSYQEARENFLKAERRLAKIERWMRTLEKRGSLAQSALNGHDQFGRYGGQG